jgi:hypothetical protein
LKDSEIKKLLLQYNEILKKLRDKGVIRTSKLVGEYGEYVAIKKLGLDLAKSGNRGYDAIDSKGKKYEIKTRKSMSYNKATKFQVTNKIFDFDFLICIIFDDDWNLTKFYKIPESKLVLSKNNIIVNKALEKYNIL